MRNRVVVIGSTNMDLVARLNRLPEKGETILGGDLSTTLGGKGANQAVAAARLGAQVAFITAIGKDAYGAQAQAAFIANEINLDGMITMEETPTGVALIMVGQDGENMIAVTPGANRYLSPFHMECCAAVIQAADCLLLQLEIPLETVAAAVEIANRNQVHIILNPAPAQSIPAAILEKVTTLTPNETEAAQLMECSDELIGSRLSEYQIKTGIENLIVTLGRKGVLLCGKQTKRIPARSVRAVDTTAAGDAFNGALAVSIARGESIESAARFANTVAALAVTKKGALEAMPTMLEVARFMEQQNRGIE